MSRSIVKALWGAIARSMALLFFMILLLGSEPAQAKKIALVLGNQQYTNIAQLNNPENDARDIAQALRSLQFELVGKDSAGDGGPVLNEDLLGMTKALTRFGREAADADLALVFYAGHGATIDGESYLLPVNALSPMEGDVLNEARLDVMKSSSLALKKVITYMDGVKGAKIAIFDACREVLTLKQRNLLGSSGNVGVLRGGLIPPGGSANQLLIAFSGASGQLVQDGTGRNSPYTTVLLEEMRQPAQRDIMSFFSDVAAKSGERLGGSVASQTPEIMVRGLRSGRYYLAGSDFGGDKPEQKTMISIDVSPPDATVLFMRRSDNVQVAMGGTAYLPPGYYDIHVDRKGYVKRMEEIRIENTPLRKDIELQRACRTEYVQDCHEVNVKGKQIVLLQPFKKQADGDYEFFKRDERYKAIDRTLDRLEDDYCRAEGGYLTNHKITYIDARNCHFHKNNADFRACYAKIDVYCEKKVDMGREDLSKTECNSLPKTICEPL